MILRRKRIAPLPPAEYGVEVLCAGWNPVAAAAPEPAMRMADRPGVGRAADAQSFLAQFYRCQQA